jgi:hypothetical protein
MYISKCKDHLPLDRKCKDNLPLGRKCKDHLPLDRKCKDNLDNCRTTNGSGCVPQQRNYKCIYPRVPVTDVYTSNISSSR